jgi:hypothetical protein
MGKLGVCCAVVLNLALVQTALAQETKTQQTPAETATINKAVSKCLDFVRTKADPVFSKGFDAYYNPATGRVENNAALIGDKESLSRFNKCMAEQGVPPSKRRQ